jgi:hypothetical protein
VTNEGREGYARPKRASGEATAIQLDPLNVAIRNLQLAHAVATSAERAATHDLVEVHCLADVLVALVPLIERGLDALDKVETRRP